MEGRNKEEKAARGAPHKQDEREGVELKRPIGVVAVEGLGLEQIDLRGSRLRRSRVKCLGFKRSEQFAQIDFIVLPNVFGQLLPELLNHEGLFGRSIRWNR